MKTVIFYFVIAAFAWVIYSAMNRYFRPQAIKELG